MRIRTENASRTVEALLEAGADVNALDARGWSPLASIAAHGPGQVAKILLDHGAQTCRPETA